MHLIYITIENIKNWWYNKSNVKQFLGYLLILLVSDNTNKKSSKFKKAVWESFYNLLKILLDSILKFNNNIDLAL